ncbi:MAG: tRNA uridine-5-carboxymethylaminomethyl(34) synthesis enzyme MnmG [Clostridia bacterium]
MTNSAKTLNTYYDAIVIGAGHAGCEAGLALARLGSKVLLLATNLDTVAYCACNPSIGGTAKGQMVREIDALGGQMGLCADSSLLQLRMLNKGKGRAVYSPRAQVDKYKYHLNMKLTLENTPNLTLRQGEATDIEQVEENDYKFAVTTAVDIIYKSKVVVVCTGVYLKSRIIIGECIKEVGPNGFASANKLSASLEKLGFAIKRFKTGTPARINKNSVDFDKMQKQEGEKMQSFSFLNSTCADNVSCYLTYSTQDTKQVILDNIDKAPLYSGSIKGVGPRYCPSIEDKIIRFADKEQHQIFLEPEGACTNEYYVQGVSSSMPAEVQYKIYTTIIGLENVEIMRDAYAIEYDCIDATTLYPYLMSKNINGLFFAGQVNGTSGYEEAAAQGIIAGINAYRHINNLDYVVLGRQTSYIGVLIDDITTKQSNEPYRMMTSRAEYRLTLRQDNADLRLTQIGRDIGLVSDLRYQKYLDKKAKIELVEDSLKTIIKPAQINAFLQDKDEAQVKSGVSIEDCIKRTNVTARELFDYLGMFANVEQEIIEQVEIAVKYKGYIDKEKLQIEQFEKLESKLIPPEFNYDTALGLRIEARQKLKAIRPLSLGQASRVSGVSPADIAILIVTLVRGAK